MMSHKIINSTLSGHYSSEHIELEDTSFRRLSWVKPRSFLLKSIYPVHSTVNHLFPSNEAAGRFSAVHPQLSRVSSMPLFVEGRLIHLTLVDLDICR
jgi:hypothetical protein